MLIFVFKVKYSSSSLFSFLKKEEERKGIVEINRICEIINTIFFDYQKVDRITVSLFRFLDKLLGSGCVDLVLEDSQSTFAKKTLKLILLEIIGCKDIYKLIDGINALCQYIQVIIILLCIYG